MKRLRNWLLFILLVFLYGSSWTVTKSGLRFIGPLNFLTQKVLFASLALSPFLMYLRERIPRDRNTWLNLLLFSLITATSMVSTNIGLAHEKSGISAVLTYTQPLFVFCLAVPLLEEKASAMRLLAIIIGFFGLTVLYVGRNHVLATISHPVLFLLFGAFGWAVATVYYKKFLSQVNTVVTNIIQLMVSVVILSILSAAFEGFAFNITGTYILIILYMSICPSAIGMTLWIFLIKEEEATVVSTSSFIVPLVALIFGWLFLRETIELALILGFSLILTGVYLVNKNH